MHAVRVGAGVPDATITRCSRCGRARPKVKGRNSGPYCRDCMFSDSVYHALVAAREERRMDEHHPGTCGPDCPTHGVAASNEAQNRFWDQRGGHPAPSATPEGGEDQ